MGLDCFIEKRPAVKKEEVKYWRKNWVLQEWMESENAVDKPITIDTMNQLLEYILDKDNHDTYGAESWTDDDWDNFADDIRQVIQDMEANSTYEYTYHGWW